MASSCRVRGLLDGAASTARAAFLDFCRCSRLATLGSPSVPPDQPDTLGGKPGDRPTHRPQGALPGSVQTEPNRRARRHQRNRPCSRSAVHLRHAGCAPGAEHRRPHRLGGGGRAPAVTQNVVPEHARSWEFRVWSSRGRGARYIHRGTLTEGPPAHVWMEHHLLQTPASTPPATAPRLRPLCSRAHLSRQRGLSHGRVMKGQMRCTRRPVCVAGALPAHSGNCPERQTGSRHTVRGLWRQGEAAKESPVTSAFRSEGTRCQSGRAPCLWPGTQLEIQSRLPRGLGPFEKALVSASP